MSWDGLLELKRIASEKYNSSTDIVSGLRLALEQARSGEVNTVIVATDEQANVTTEDTTEMELIRKMLDMDVKVAVLNPTPYPVHVTDIRDKRLIYVPAPNPESLTAALRLIQIRRELQHASAREIMELLANK